MEHSLSGTISKEIRQAIYNLHDQGKSVKEIYSVLKMQNISISEKSVSRIVKEDRDKDNTNKSFLSCIPDDEIEVFNPKTNVNTDFDEFNDSFSNETKDKTKEERQEEIKDNHKTKEETKENIHETVQAIQVNRK